MALKEKIKKLATVKAGPCVSISLNTHRTRPASDKDKILLKNLLSQAEKILGVSKLAEVIMAAVVINGWNRIAISTELPID